MRFVSYVICAMHLRQVVRCATYVKNVLPVSFVIQGRQVVRCVMYVSYTTHVITVFQPRIVLFAMCVIHARIA